MYLFVSDSFACYGAILFYLPDGNKENDAMFFYII